MMKVQPHMLDCIYAFANWIAHSQILELNENCALSHLVEKIRCYFPRKYEIRKQKLTLS